MPDAEQTFNKCSCGCYNDQHRIVEDENLSRCIKKKDNQLCSQIGMFIIMVFDLLAASFKSHLNLHFLRREQANSPPHSAALNTNVREVPSTAWSRRSEQRCPPSPCRRTRAPGAIVHVWGCDMYHPRQKAASSQGSRGYWPESTHSPSRGAELTVGLPAGKWGSLGKRTKTGR